MLKRNKHIYTPESPLANLGLLFAELRDNVFSSWELASRLAIRDFKAQYRQSYMGYFWVVLGPVISSVTFIILRDSGALAIGETEIPYPAYIFIGTVLWQIFLLSLNNPLGKFQGNRDLLMKVNFPREALILSGIISTVLEVAVRLLLLIPVLAWYRFDLNWTVLLLPFGLIAIILLGTSLGLLLVPIASLYHDVQRILGSALMFWMFFSPVIIPPAKEGIAKLIMDLNPVTYVMMVTRGWITGGDVDLYYWGFICTLAGSMVILAIAWLCFRVSLPHIIARMGM